MISQTISPTVTTIDFQTHNSTGFWTVGRMAKTSATYCMELTQLNSHDEIKMSDSCRLSGNNISTTTSTTNCLSQLTKRNCISSAFEKQ